MDFAAVQVLSEKPNQEALLEDATNAGNPLDPVQENWHNPLPDAILKNSVVLGMRHGTVTMIISVSPTTLKAI